MEILFTKFVWGFARWTGLDRLWREKVAEIRCRFLVESGRRWAFVETRIEERVGRVAADKVASASRIVIVVIAGGVRRGARIPAAATGRIAIVVSGGRSWPVLTVTGRIVRREGSERWEKRAKTSVSISVVMEC